MTALPRRLCWSRREVLLASGALVGAAALAPRSAGAAQGELLGPLVGHVTDTTAALWAHAPLGSTLSAWVRPAESSEALAPLCVPLAQLPDEDGVARALVTGLAPATRYVYALRWDERSEPAWTGGFRTAPAPGSPTRLRLATSSCMKPDQPGDLFERLRSADPHLNLLLGDNAYADSPRPEVLWREHRRMRAVPELAALLRHVPTYAIWDDHDYGGNDADGTLVGKQAALSTFQRLFANPSYGLADVPGVFTRFAWGDVDVFLLDVRYERSPKDAPDGPQKRVLGAAQMAWLEQGLTTSQATFKLVASGSALDAPERDSWRDYPTDRARLFQILAEQRVGGVVFLTGDLHRCLVQVHEPARSGTYPVPEVVSSGIAIQGPRACAVLDLDTTSPDPTLRVRILQADGSVPVERTFLRSALGGR